MASLSQDRRRSKRQSKPSQRFKAAQESVPKMHSSTASSLPSSSPTPVVVTPSHAQPPEQVAHDSPHSAASVDPAQDALDADGSFSTPPPSKRRAAAVSSSANSKPSSSSQRVPKRQRVSASPSSSKSSSVAEENEDFGTTGSSSSVPSSSSSSSSSDASMASGKRLSSSDGKRSRTPKKMAEAVKSFSSELCDAKHIAKPLDMQGKSREEVAQAARALADLRELFIIPQFLNALMACPDCRHKPLAVDASPSAIRSLVSSRGAGQGRSPMMKYRTDKPPRFQGIQAALYILDVAKKECEATRLRHKNGDRFRLPARSLLSVVLGISGTNDTAQTCQKLSHYLTEYAQAFRDGYKPWLQQQARARADQRRTGFKTSGLDRTQRSAKLEAMFTLDGEMLQRCYEHYHACMTKWSTETVSEHKLASAEEAHRFGASQSRPSSTGVNTSAAVIASPHSLVDTSQPQPPQQDSQNVLVGSADKFVAPEPCPKPVPKTATTAAVRRIRNTWFQYLSGFAAGLISRRETNSSERVEQPDPDTERLNLGEANLAIFLLTETLDSRADSLQRTLDRVILHRANLLEERARDKAKIKELTRQVDRLTPLCPPERLREAPLQAQPPALDSPPAANNALAQSPAMSVVAPSVSVDAIMDEHSLVHEYIRQQKLLSSPSMRANPDIWSSWSDPLPVKNSNSQADSHDTGEEGEDASVFMEDDYEEEEEDDDREEWDDSFEGGDDGSFLDHHA